MSYSVLAFALGVLLFQQMPSLPAAYWLLLATPLAVWLWRRPVPWRVSALALAGFCWSWGHHLLCAPATLPATALGRSVQVEGRVLDLPNCDDHRCSFWFLAERIWLQDHPRKGRWKFRLNWYHPQQPLSSGDRWRLRLKLKAAVSYRNPGSFDYAGWLQARGVRYRGYVKGGAERLEKSGWRLDRMRQRLSHHIRAAVSNARVAGVLRALVVGDRSGLRQADRERFAATGTAHLMAISGLHVGLVAGLIWLLGMAAWRRLPALCARWPAPVAAAPLALLAAFGYAALAGFALPTQRALIMLTVVLAAVVARRQVRSWSVLATALLLVLLWDPNAVRGAGFWLSFGAVALLFWLSSLLGRSRGSRLWIQAGLSVGLLPLLAWQQMPLSMVSPLVNLVAIPLFSLVVVPGALLAVGVAASSGWTITGPLQAMAWIVQWALQGLAWAADWNPAWSVTVVRLLVAAWFLLALWLWRRAGGRRSALGVPALLLLPSAALFLTPAARLPPNQFELTLLDVGQGLSAVVRTRHHLLVYDTGPSFPSGFNTGSAVVAPYLRTRGLNHIDLLVLSHGDNDHVGGARGLLRQAEVARIVSGEPGRLHLARKVAACREGTQWWWDGVHFAFLSPPVDSGMEGNDASCVLRISSGGSVLLITGDIEAEVENRLVAAVPRRLRSSVVVAAHHGSSSSSSPAFVAAAQPRYVLFSAGVGNRWHFPRREVVARWCKVGARTLNTAAEGAIRMRFTPSGAVLEERHARSHRHYWQNGSRTDFSRSGRKIPPACSMIAHYETED